MNKIHLKALLGAMSFMAMLAVCSFEANAATTGCGTGLVQSIFTPMKTDTSGNKVINCVNPVMNIDITNPVAAYPELLGMAGQVNPKNPLLQEQVTTATGQFNGAITANPADATAIANANVQSMQSAINTAQTAKLNNNPTTSFENSFGRSTVSQSLKLHKVITTSAISSARKASAGASGAGEAAYRVREGIVDALLLSLTIPVAVSCTCTTTYCVCVPARLIQYTNKLTQMAQDETNAISIVDAWRGLAKDVKEATADVGNRVNSAIASSSQAKMEQKSKIFNDKEAESARILDDEKVIERSVNQGNELAAAEDAVAENTTAKSNAYAKFIREASSKDLTDKSRKIAKSRDGIFTKNEDIRADILMKSSYSDKEAAGAALFIDYITIGDGISPQFNSKTLDEDVSAQDLKERSLELQSYMSLPRYHFDNIHSERVVISGMGNKLDVPHGPFGNDMSMMEAYHTLSGIKEPTFWAALWSGILFHKPVYAARVMELNSFKNKILTKIYEQQELNSAMFAAYASDTLKGKAEAVNNEIQGR